jgi:SAM-dependent methyltransferase
LPAQRELKERFAEYDLLVTHFGLSAFEALYARLPVLLVSPTAYHEKLAKSADFVSAGKGPAARRLSRLFSRPGFYETLCRESETIARRHGLEAAQTQTLGGFLAGCTVNLAGGRAEGTDNRAKGPAGGIKVLARFAERSYCRREGLIVMKRLTPPPVEYETDYFFGQYKKQYGKTYLEDFPGLAAAGRRRLAHIKALLKTGKGSRAAAPVSGTPPAVLDIGCAYGPFLAAARDEGFAPAGLEPAEDAARYVRETLGIPCVRGFFPGGFPGTAPEYDAVTLWYVIEHFRDPGPVLQAIRRILKPGGVLAFSTPSFSGVSGRSSLVSFLKNSPPDHWSVWSPKTCAAYLKQHGFKVKKIVVTGHHPERFPLIGARLSGKGPLYRLFLAISKIFRLGDTFEVYAAKEGPDFL